MNTSRLAMGAAIGLVMAITIGSAEAKELLKVKGSASGSFVNTQSDTNKDGLKGSLSMVRAKSTLGPLTGQGVGELAFSKSATCPNGNAGFELTLVPGTGHDVVRVDRTGDLIFDEGTSQTVCIDPKTGIEFFNGTFNITGGTGRFAGATGSGSFSGTAKTLFFDEAGGNFFGEFSEEFTVTMILPFHRDAPSGDGED